MDARRKPSKNPISIEIDPFFHCYQCIAYLIKEWSKFSNYRVATQVPWLLYVPAKDDDRGLKLRQIFAAAATPREEADAAKEDTTTMAAGEVIKKPVQLLDLFPTLVHLAGLPALKRCNQVKPSEKLEAYCTQGVSIFDDQVSTDDDGQSRAYWQYPRPTQYPSIDSDHPTKANYMGYSVLEPPYRLTKWVRFNSTTFEPNWNHEVALELYDHDFDPLESTNIADGNPTTVERLDGYLQKHFGY